MNGNTNLQKQHVVEEHIHHHHHDGCCGSSNSPVQRSESKVGRNDPCLCGSGKKYKKCCIS